MARKDYSEDLMIQAPTAELLHKQLGWLTVFAQDDEGFGPQSLLGRSNQRADIQAGGVLGGALEMLRDPQGGIAGGHFDKAARGIAP